MMFEDKILEKYKNIFSHYECYLVGGYLRNYLMNKEISSDRDLAVMYNSKGLAQEIAKSGGVLIELDKENEIYRVVLEDKKNYFDISRIVEDDIMADVKRRDFTINAIYYDLNRNKIFDPLNGVLDIKESTLKTPNLNNFLDDPLRMLRLYRFKSKTGFSVDCDTKKFVIENFHLVQKCAYERINSEIINLFEGEYLVDTLLEMYEDGVLEIIFPFVQKIKKIPPNTHHHLDLIHHSIETVKNIKSNKPLLKLAALYHDIGKPSTWTIEDTGRHRFIGHDLAGSELVKEELKKLKFSRAQISYISKMVRYHIYPSSLMAATDTKKAFARFVKKIGSDTPDLIELSRADRLSARGEAVSDEMIEKNMAHLDSLFEFYQKIQNEVKAPKPLLDGREIMEILNIKPSKQVGEILDKLLEAQFSGHVKTKEKAIKFIKGL